ncbi:MAG: methyltransferase domain-containing protein [Chloroflexi bacterium]|nr:methyltransferase domain-containing protein [Chloroflexota bacterium]
MNDLVFDSLVLHSHDRVLEVGFGGGYLLGRMAAVVTHGFIAGVDVSETMVAVCERRYQSLVRAGRLELRCALAESLPYSSDHFSKACTVNSLFYWTDALRVLEEIHRVLEEGGKLVLCVTRKQSIENKRFAGHGMGLYEDEEVCQMMEGDPFIFILSLKAGGTGLNLTGRQPCLPLRPLVEPSRGGPGYRPRLPHRSDTQRAGTQEQNWRRHHDRSTTQDTNICSVVIRVGLARGPWLLVGASVHERVRRIEGRIRWGAGLRGPRCLPGAGNIRHDPHRAQVAGSANPGRAMHRCGL